MLRSAKKIKVLVVDDSALYREMLSEIIASDPELEVIGTASDPYFARDKIKKLNPDVLTLDVEMPRMNGLAFLEKLMHAHPMPVVMISSKTRKNTQATIKALQLGAVDFIAKPAFSNSKSFRSVRKEVVTKIKTAAKARVRKKDLTSLEVMPKYSADVVLKRERFLSPQQASSVIAIGASTGGTLAICNVLKPLRPPICGIVIVQHMPPDFTRAFADRMNELCHIEVHEAKHGDRVRQNRALIAPGGLHMILQRDGRGYWVDVKDGQAVNRHKPSVDVLFRSTANSAGKGAIGVILTGMGDDGASGMKEMREMGAYTIAQDENSCVVFGMPKTAIEKGGVCSVISIDKISETLQSRLKSQEEKPCLH